MRVLLPRRLRAVPELGPYEIHVGALSKTHVGLVVAIVRKQNTLTGRLRAVPAESQVKPLLVVELGDFRKGMHPSEKVMVIPDGYRATVSVAPVGGDA